MLQSEELEHLKQWASTGVHKSCMPNHYGD